MGVALVLATFYSRQQLRGIKTFLVFHSLIHSWRDMVASFIVFFTRNLNYATAIMSDHLLDQLDSKQTIAQYNKKNSRHSGSVATNHCGREMIWKSFCPGLGQALTMAEILGIKCEERLLQRTDVETLIVIVYTRSYNFGCKQ